MDHRTLVDTLIDAWYTGDAAKAMSLYHDECQFRDSANPQGIIGKPAIAKYLAWLNSTSPMTTFEITGIDEIEGGAEFLVTWRYRVPDNLAGEASVAIVDGLQFLAFNDGKLVRSECYYDQVPLVSEILLSTRVEPEYCASVTSNSSGAVTLRVH